MFGKRFNMANKILHQRNVQSAKSYASGRKSYGKHDDMFLKEVRLSQDLHLSHDIISQEELNKQGKIKTKKDKDAYIFDASFTDNFDNLTRAAQIINLKDAAVILAETGITNESIIFDSGSGSGGLALFLAKHSKHVYSFEIKDEHLEACEKNKKFLNIENINFYKADITNINEIKDIVKDIKCDVFTIDVLHPTKAIDTVREFLKLGGYAIFYVTQINQAKEVVNNLDESDDFSVFTCKEILHREWDLHNRKCKPKGLTHNHTGFLVFARKVN
jgi:tRNA (adenine57-N1/adenine58-N1)-methyltransferase catalytic subunit